MAEVKCINDSFPNTILGMNGGCPESPDGKRIVYAAKDSLMTQDTTIMICDSNFTNHKEVYKVRSGNHNGPSQTFIDNSLIVFRDTEEKHGIFRIINVDTKEILYEIRAKESHCAESGLYPFSISEEYLGLNPDYPAIDGCGIFILNVRTGEIKKVASEEDIIKMCTDRGLKTNEFTGKVSHVQLSPKGTAIMMRIGVDDCPVFGALGCFDIDTGKTHIIPDKPVHQLWYDDETYMATRQFNQGRHIECESSYLARFSKDGEELEVLGGISNHMDGSPDRKYFAGDRAYPEYQTDVYLYKKGNKSPIATFPMAHNEDIVWNRKVHPNPSFSRDGKRLYFNKVMDDGTVKAVCTDISEYLI